MRYSSRIIFLCIFAAFILGVILMLYIIISTSSISYKSRIKNFDVISAFRRKSKPNTKVSLLTIRKCLDLLPQPNFTSLIIDTEILQNIIENKCRKVSRAIKIALHDKMYQELKRSDQLGRKFSIANFSYPEDTDYMRFHDDETGRFARIIPRIKIRSCGEYQVPADILLFLEYWKRSRYIDCLNLTVERKPMEQVLDPVISVMHLAELRNMFVSFNMYPLLNGGTLLGWYRECSVIPHTTDLDFSVKYDEFDISIIEEFWKPSTKFLMNRRLGMPNDSFEITVSPVDNPGYPIDVFVMYDETNHSYVSGTNHIGMKFRYKYPLYDRYCSADLKGKLFWITCDPEGVVKFEYGPMWMKDHNSKNFSWFSSSSNVERNGHWDVAELDDVIQANFQQIN
ncbi:hypothetical protein WR25_21304 isoform C [Diploscapter pachys]|uniref:W02B3.4-like N-terminal domain-containing protein n=2 Tax=Diploscapter pachys TaxID=2018661 RepID=A0A2A2M0W1_9BILA|nr:hypothetical protein WR25_21304 isoform C [Diploscapter pachys]